MCLAVRARAPYALALPVEKVSATAGGSFATKVTVRRQWPDFKGPVRLNGLNLPPGFSFATTEVPADRDTFAL